MFSQPCLRAVSLSAPGLSRLRRRGPRQATERPFAAQVDSHTSGHREEVLGQEWDDLLTMLSSFSWKALCVLSAKLKWAHRPCQGPRGILVGAKALTNRQIFLEIHF